ncbi:MAG: DUF1080 domain-containing protein, partial [Pyrinomonadaceae bacterium]|nr:DUF1080 domain-containing protein [Sphingobacteriaceae bacterium]
MKRALIFAIIILTSLAGEAQERRGDPALTEIWSPVPAIVVPGKTSSDAPSDALVLF